MGLHAAEANSLLNSAAARFTTMHKAGGSFLEMQPYRHAYNRLASSSAYWSKLSAASKIAGQGLFFLSGGVNSYRAGNAIYSGDYAGAVKPGADLIFGAAAFTGTPVGLTGGISYTATSFALEFDVVYHLLITKPLDGHEIAVSYSTDLMCRTSGRCR